MKKFILTPTLIAIATLMTACGTVPNTTSLLDQSRSDYQTAQADPNVVNYATLELKQAGDALALANAAASSYDSADNINKLAYLAKQKIALSQEVAKQKSAEAEIANAGKERDQVRLDQRTNEANIAKNDAEKSKIVALIARDDAQQAQRQKQVAEMETANALRQTQEAQARSKEAQAKSAQLEAQLAELAAKKTDRGMVITLGDVLFGTDIARLNNDGIRTTQKLATVLQQNPKRNVMIEGFADSTGTAVHNQELSERRANAVVVALQDQGIARERITARGYGESHPVAANDTASNRQLNRRVEIILSDDKGTVIAR